MVEEWKYQVLEEVLEGVLEVVSEEALGGLDQ